MINLNSIKNIFSKKSTKDGLNQEKIFAYWLPQDLEPDLKTISFIQMYKECLPLQIFVNKIATAFAEGKMFHKKVTPKGIIDITDTSRIIKGLKNPTPLIDGINFRKTAIIYKLITGSSFVYVTNKDTIDKLPPQFNLIATSDIKAAVKEDYNLFSYVNDISKIIDYFYLFNITENQIAPKDILFFKEPAVNLDYNGTNKISLYGDSKLQCVVYQNSILNEILKTKYYSLKKRGTSVIISEKAKNPAITQAMHDSTKKKKETALVNDYGFGENKSPVYVTSNEIEVHNINLNLDALKLNETEAAILKDLCFHFGLSMALFANSNENNRANADSANVELYTLVSTMAGEFAEAINNFFGLQNSNEYIEFDYSHVPCMQNSMLNKIKLLTEAVSHAIITPHDAAKLAGMPTVENEMAKRLWMQNNISMLP